MTETAANKGEKFVENLAHDLKSPIFSQINALNILLKDKSFHYNDIQIELLNSVLTSNIYMRDMVLNLLSGFRMKNSNIKANIKNFEYYFEYNIVYELNIIIFIYYFN